MVSGLSTWCEIMDASLAFLPIGSTEQHGPHLPLLTDSIIANAIADRLAKKIEGSYLLPTLNFSSSFEHSGFPGSVSLRVSTLSSVVGDIIFSLENSGIRKCIIVTGHMGNHLLRNITQELNVAAPRVLLLPSAKHWQHAYATAGLSSTTSTDMHAGEGETSILMHLSENFVRKDKLADWDNPSRPLLETTGMRKYTTMGHIGFPTQATSEKGKELLDALTNDLTQTIKEFLEIAQN